MSYEERITDSDVLDGLSVRYLKIFGLWRVINDYRTTGKRNAIIKLEFAITLILVLPYIFCQYLSYFVIEVDIQKATFLNLNTFPALQMVCRISLFWFRMENQCRLYNLMRKDFLTSFPHHKRAEAEEIYKKISKKSNRFCMAAFCANCVAIFTSVTFPGISVDYIAHHTGNMFAVTGGKKKIMGGWYPLPMAEYPYYEAIFVYETVTIVLGGVFLAVYVCMFYQVLMCLYAQYSVLAFHICSLNICDVNRRDIEDENSRLKKELYGILRDHQKLLRYTYELRSVYNPLVTVILGMGVFVLVNAVFQFLFGSTSNPMYVFEFVEFFTYQSIEVSMFCLGSSSLESASSDLQFAIYSSDWYKADITFRKTAQMLMVRARNGETLNAFKMYPVKAETLMSILQVTYSTAALISKMVE